MIIPLIKFFLNPFNLLWILILISILAWYYEKGKLAKRLLYLTGILFLVSSTPLIPGLLINSLENRYAPVFIKDLSDPVASYHIVVLGGGHALDDALPANSLLSHNALGRLSEGIRLHRQLPGSKLILSGFSGSGGTTQAEMLQKTALLLGVKKEHMILQIEPASTYEEAKKYSGTFGDTHSVILVTSAAHMTRAMNIFKQFNINAKPSPTNFRLKKYRKNKWLGLPSMSNIENLRITLYEYAGIIYYKYLIE